MQLAPDPPHSQTPIREYWRMNYEWMVLSFESSRRMGHELEVNFFIYSKMFE